MVNKILVALQLQMLQTNLSMSVPNGRQFPHLVPALQLCLTCILICIISVVFGSGVAANNSLN